MKLYTKINLTWTLAKLDLMFFPILFEDHWVLLCVNMFMKQIAFFNSLNGSKDTLCLKRAENLIQNFAATTQKGGILKTDVSHFEWIFPAGYPMQKNLCDCGIYE